ncbi:MAG: FecR family protein [Mucilaginibacter sp.]
MKDYKNYKVNDYVSDRSFIEWVLRPEKSNHLFWDSLLLNNPESAETVHRARLIIKSLYIKPSDHQLSDDEVLAITNRFEKDVKQQVNDGKQRNSYGQVRKLWTSVAAAVVLGFTFSLLVYHRPKNGTTDFHLSKSLNISNRTHNSRLIQLSDGTLIVLKPKSEISFPQKFQGKRREVFLSGEAFFEVHKNPLVPFLVHSGTIITKVLGTSFTVSAFPRMLFKVTVNAGKVQVYQHKENDDLSVLSSVTLTPNQQVILAGKNVTLKKDSVTTPQPLSPEVASKVFSFTNAPLQKVISQLEEAYNIPVIYDKMKYSKVTITASLANLPLNEKIRAICKVIDASYEFTDNSIIIK